MSHVWCHRCSLSKVLNQNLNLKFRQMDFWFEFLDIHMNKKITTCHDCHGFKWEKIYLSLILTTFLYNRRPLWLNWLWLHLIWQVLLYDFELCSTLPTSPRLLFCFDHTLVWMTCIDGNQHMIIDYHKLKKLKNIKLHRLILWQH